MRTTALCACAGRVLVGLALSACGATGGVEANDGVTSASARPTNAATSKPPASGAEPSGEPMPSATLRPVMSASNRPQPSAAVSASVAVSASAPRPTTTDDAPPVNASALPSLGEPPIPPGSGPLGNETTCDGVDDDKNGVIDDVDVAADGVCDCLRIATLGLHGEWGDGDVLKTWFVERAETQATAISAEDLTAEGLAPYHILLIRDVSLNHNASLSFTATQAEALKQWVRDGGGLMTVIGYSDAGEASNVNTLLAPFSLSYSAEQIVQGQGAAVAVTEWFEHPLTRGVTQVGADNGYPAEGQGATIAAQDGFDVGKAVTIGDGHVLVWGDEWITYADEWSSSTTYQVDRFWRNALVWLARADQCQVPVE